MTAGYFKALIEVGAFDGSSIFRIVGKDNVECRPDHPIEVVQGGLKAGDNQPVAPIAHEPTSQTGIQHIKWTVSAARFDPGETYGSFFICMADTPSLDEGGERHSDGHGFAGFGRIVSGFNVLGAIFVHREASEMLEVEIPIHRARIVK
ncbi:peptidylprolyl isomerase [Parasphingorhabdus litoris]|uniref:peptidylprolyl isomerase n=1 Tax=Parasphingorhabdus litoris TaxID=394733 RepID=UPI001E61AA07|nr:peptidylprolyl isomerase [Parasphingorhabdus litoris]